MEEPRMVGRIREHARLLIGTAAALCCVLAAPFPASAESGPEEALAVILTQEPDVPVLGRPFTLALLVDHPAAAEVRVDPPPFPAALRPDRVRAAPRAVPGFSGGSERWTAVEYVFTVAASGSIEIGPFSVEAGGKRAETEPLTLIIAENGESSVAAALRWSADDAAERALRAGRPAEVRLILSGAEGAEAFRSDAAAPERAALEALPIDAALRLAGVVGRYRLIPLESGSLRLPPVELRLKDGRSLRSPPLVLAAAAPGAAAAEPASSRPAGREVPERTASFTAPAFPKAAALPFPFLRARLESLLAPARERWAAGDYVSALAFLRAAERDDPLGMAVEETRAAAERSLSLGAGFDEPYAPRVPFAIAALLASLFWLPVFLGAAAALIRKKPVTSAGARRFLIAAAALVLTVFCALRPLYAGLRARGYALLSACYTLRVPDGESARSASFQAGQSVRTVERARSGGIDWLFVEAEDGRSGWVEAARARRY